MSDLNRREFVVAAACAAGACLMCSGMTDAADTPADSQASTASTSVDVGTASDFPKDGAYDKLADTKKIIIVRNKNKIYALSAVCTHKMGTVKVKGDELLCSKHNSHFTYEGATKAGPAKAALFHLGISTNPEGHILVDTSKRLGEKQLEEAGASISVK